MTTHDVAGPTDAMPLFLESDPAVEVAANALIGPLLWTPMNS
ncbi:hypothetical protein QF000_001655 [Paraburkholderia atlantica]|uniref:Uncharacterized protein n=1 Tax=Paraburkholderia atlantica TaxID=2654982 RepID=A0A7W8UWS1_PARAM|nr:hypothetical protein [Paraburkholderia atlantica]MBB5427115.1 hypothetical protein [Paraburkholderia atlantica]